MMILPREILQQASRIKDNNLRQAFCEGAKAYAEYVEGNESAMLTEVLPPQFEDFWELYDKKRGKPKCITLWARMTDSEKKQCMAYIPLYKESQPDKQYRKDPQTFLRNKCWNDELIYCNNARASNYTNTTSGQRTTANQQERDYLEGSAANILAGVN